MPKQDYLNKLSKNTQEEGSSFLESMITGKNKAEELNGSLAAGGNPLEEKLNTIRSQKDDIEADATTELGGYQISVNQLYKYIEFTKKFWNENQGIRKKTLKKKIAKRLNVPEDLALEFINYDPNKH